MRNVELLSLCLQTPGCLPPLCWGHPGIGKTSAIEQFCTEFDWNLEILRPAERGEGALGVVPVPSEDRSVLHYPMPDWAERLARSSRQGLLFLDEVSSTPPALQPAIMGLALDGIIAGQRLPSHIKRAAAANPSDQAAGGWDLALPLANRFVHIDWQTPRIDEWIDWLSGHAATARGVTLDLDKWEQEWPKAKALGAAFLRSHPSCLMEDLSKVVGRTPPAYTTPRSWESALRLLAACRATGRDDLYPPLAAGVLGPAVALEGTTDARGAWLVWLQENDLPDPEDLLKDPGLFRHDPRRPDRTFATLYAVAEAALMVVSTSRKLNPEARGKRWQQAWSVLALALDQKIGKDMVLLAAKQLADKRRRPKYPVNPDGNRVCGVLDDFIDLYA